MDLISYSQTTQFSKYRPLFNELSAAKVINQIKTLKIFMRDFNIDIIISNSDHDKLEQFCSLFNLKSFIKKETCITKLHMSTIDLIIKNKPLSFQNSSFIKTGLSDPHKLITTFAKSHFTWVVTVTVYYRNFTKADEKSFLNDLRNDIRNKFVNLTIFHQMIQMRIIVSLLILSLRLSNVMHLWKRDLSEEIKSLLWTRELRKVIYTISRLRNNFVKTPPKRMQKVQNTTKQMCISQKKKYSEIF